MAIKIYDNWHSIIVKADSIVRIYGENGLEAFLKDFFPGRHTHKRKITEKRESKCFLSLFSKSKLVQIEIEEPYSLEDYSYQHIAKKFNHVIGCYGHDGNLVYISSLYEEEISACCEWLNQKGFYGYKSVIYVEDVDYVIFEKDGFPINVPWLETVEMDNGSKYTAPYYVYSISPFKQPMPPTSFPSIQGGIRYETEFQWNLSQRYIQNKEFDRFRELRDVSLLYTNCNGGDIVESIDDWLKAYDTPIDLSKLSGNMEYKLLSIFGDCIRTRNFIPLYRFLDETPICRFGMNEAESPVSKHDLTIKLTRLFEKGKKNYSIQFQPKKNKYVGFIQREGIKEIVDIEVRHDKINTLWIVKEEFHLLFKEAVPILRQIANEWNHGNPLSIERYLAENFKYTLYGEREIFGSHVLSKRQFIVWWEIAYENYAKSGAIFKVFYDSGGDNGICCVIKEKGFAIYTTFDIVDGVIISAKEEKIIPFEDVRRI